jgi:hypothetical protein
MASETIYITGTSSWAKVFPHSKDKNEEFHGPGGAYTLDLYVEKEELDKYVATGSRSKPRVGEDGMYIKLKRKHTHSIDAFGGAPQVVDADKNEWDGSLIGNGSLLECAVTVYDTKMGKGTRLEGIRVIEYVELPPLDDAEGGRQKKLPF